MNDLNAFLVGNTTRFTDHEKNSDWQHYRTALCFLIDIANARRFGKSGQNRHFIPLKLTPTVMATEPSALASLQQTLCLYRSLVGNI